MTTSEVGNNDFVVQQEYDQVIRQALDQEAEQDENATVHTDEDIIRDGGYFGEDDSK